MNKIITVKLLPKQYQFVKSKKREVLFTGSYGSGKTVALCYKLLTHAIIPNNLCLLTRKTRASLTNSTLRTLLHGDGNMPPILIPGSYEVNESKSVIRLNGGGTIVFKGCDDDLAIRSMNLGGIAIDEAIELTDIEYEALIGRLRNNASDNRQIFMATNPGSQNHFLYKRFFDNFNNDTMDKVTSTINDNRYLPKDYVESIKRFTGSNFKRYAEGIWCSNQGCVYKEYEISSIIDRDVKEFTKFIIGVDIGYSKDPTAILVIGRSENSLHTFEEFYQTNITPTEITAKISELYDKYKTGNDVDIVIDPSSAGIRLECEAKGLNIIKGNNSINEGISRVKDLLSSKRLTFNRNLTNLEKEFDQYIWQTANSDKPGDAYNHALDALRYAVNHWFDQKNTIITPSIYSPSDDVDRDDDNWK